jgi:hypothetical protein
MKSMDHDHAFAPGGHVDGPCDAVPALHPHLPQLPFQVLDMWFTHCGKTVFLDELRNAKEALPGILRQGVKLPDHATIEHFDSSSHEGEHISKLRYVQFSVTAGGAGSAPKLPAGSNRWIGRTRGRIEVR